jgi:hypothetical protein
LIKTLKQIKEGEDLLLQFLERQHGKTN